MFLVKSISTGRKLVLGSGVGLNNFRAFSTAVEEKAPKKKIIKPRHTEQKKEVLLTKLYPTAQIAQEFVPYKVTRDQLKQSIENKENVIIIDLRSPKEFYADSPIRESFNIPMEYPKIVNEDTSAHSQKRGKKNKVVQAKKAYDADADLNFWQKVTKMTPIQWKEKFGFVKVSKNDSIIFYSANNGRGSQVVDMAIKEGYSNAKFLEGGIRSWNKFSLQV